MHIIAASSPNPFHVTSSSIFSSEEVTYQSHKEIMAPLGLANSFGGYGVSNHHSLAVNLNGGSHVGKERGGKNIHQ